jgi:hypothetical protein
MGFSLVCPVAEKDWQLLRITLPSFYAVKPSEVLLCTDKPAPKKILEVVESLHARVETRVIEVENNGSWAFHQMNVRRSGFTEAKHDKILNTDADLVLNKNVLKALKIVGKGNIGLVSLSKEYISDQFQRVWRNISYQILRDFMHKVSYTGLYALDREAWLDSEDQEEAKKIVNPKYCSLKEANIGDDGFIHDCMIHKHRVIYLPDVGATELSVRIEDLPRHQFECGRYFATRGFNIWQVIAETMLFLRPHMLKGWVYQKYR